MLNETYSSQYLTHGHIFTQFFEGLKDFYREYPIDIRKLIRQLFVDLTVIMFNILNHNEKTNNAHKLNETCIDLNLDFI